MANKETELTLYVKLEDPNFNIGHLDEWKQYETKFNNGTRFRVRLYKDDKLAEGIRAEQTIKVDSGVLGGVKSSDEYTCIVPLGFAEGLLKACESVQNKVRNYLKSNKVYVKFKRGEEVEVHEAPELCIELDRFVIEPGVYHQWAKVDIEIDALLKWINSTYGPNEISGYSIDLENILPTKVLETIAGNTKDPQEMETLSELWDTVFKQKI